MVVYGTKSLKSVINTGVFHCPHCREKVNFKHVRVKRWGHLYFIPVAPVKVLGEYVECQACMNTYTPEVLQYDPKAEERALEATYYAGIKRVMVQMVLADSAIRPAELELVRGLYQSMTKQLLTDEDLEREIASVRASSGTAMQYLRNLSGSLNDNGKRRIVRAATMVAAADGELQNAERQLITEIGVALAMTGEEVKQTVIETLTPTPPT